VPVARPGNCHQLQERSRLQRLLLSSEHLAGERLEPTLRLARFLRARIVWCIDWARDRSALDFVINAVDRSIAAALGNREVRSDQAVAQTCQSRCRRRASGD